MYEQHAGHLNGEGVVCLATDATNSFLISGDGAGYLKVWDVHSFVNVPGLDNSGHVIELRHWRAHEGALASLDFIEKRRLLLSAASDARIKLWSLEGELAGVLGDSYNLSDPST